jgi:hypothetical protein
MAYSVRMSIFDFGSFFSPPPPTIIGRFSPASGPPIETTAATTTPAGLTIGFTSTGTPPTGPSTLLVTDAGTSGDVFRSGVVSAWPAGPATLTVVSVPVTSPTTGAPLTTFSTARIATMVAPLAGRRVPLPAWVIIVTSILTAGTFIPTGMTISSVAVATSAPNLITVTITGTFAFTKFYFFALTSIFTATVTLAVAPSGDAGNRARIFAVSVASSVLNPGFITPGISLTLWMFAPLVAQIAAGAIDGAINGAIMSMVGTSLSGSGSVSPVGAVTLSPTASICARRITVLPGGLTAQMIVSDVLGPAIILPAAPLGTMAVSIAPTPVDDDMANSYSVLVANQATNVPISGADVRIRTGSDAGAAQTLSRTTNQSGVATFLKTTIRYMERGPRGPGSDGDMELVAPSLTVTSSGFTSVKRNLL